MEDKFNVDIAIEDGGICRRQKVDCAVCGMGNFIFTNKLKGCETDYCSYQYVELFSSLLKRFNPNDRMRLVRRCFDG